MDDILPYIARGDLDSGVKVDAAIEYGQKSVEFSKSEFENSCGVGLTVTNEDIENAVQKQDAIPDNMCRAMSFW